MISKSGFAYYNVDTDRYQDMRIKKLKRDLGFTGLCIYDYILCEIYRVKGCFLVWDESTAFDVSDYFAVKETVVNEVVQYCCSVGLFSKELLSSGGVLTSKSIQRRYIDMCKRSKRKECIIPEEVAILPEECAKTPEECEEIPEEIDKVKKSKVKKSKVKESNYAHDGNVLKNDLSKSNLFRQPIVPSYEDVLQAFSQSGGTEEMAKVFFEKNSSTGWFLPVFLSGGFFSV